METPYPIFPSLLPQFYRGLSPHQGQFELLKYSWVWPSTGVWLTYQEPNPLIKLTPSPHRSYQLPISPLIKMELHVYCIIPTRILSALSFNRSWLCNCHTVSRKHWLPLVIRHFWQLHFLSPISHHDPWAVEGAIVQEMLHLCLEENA